MIRLDAATVLLQWATGGLLFLWVTTRRRQVGIGYGWLLRSIYLVMALGALATGRLSVSEWRRPLSRDRQNPCRRCFSRRRHRRHAPRPLVPGAARPGTRSPRRAERMGRPGVAHRGGRPVVAGRDGLGPERVDRR